MLRRGQGEGGQAMVEFIIVLPLFFALLWTVVQFGVLFRQQLALSDAVRVAARKAAVSRFAADPAAATRAVGEDVADLPSKPTIDVDSDWKAGSAVTVTGTYHYTFDILGIGVYSGDLVSVTKDRVE
jgi:Flp pilus assembly protein TadG